MVIEEQHNLFGGLIFWSYIIAALAFTSIVLKTLHDIQPAKIRTGNEKKDNVALFSGLAAVSFTTLSYNMLNVLFDSYTVWAHHRSLSLADTSATSIWRWSITSTLFQDFGNAIVQSSGRYLWVEASLLATLCVCLHVGIEGQYRNVPRLWAFVGLTQILPVSFTQNLFYIAVLRQGQTRPQWQVSKGMVVVLAGMYCACLIVAPIMAGTRLLIPHILLARAILVAIQVYPWKRGNLPEQKAPADDDGLLDAEGLSGFLTLLATLCIFAQGSLTVLEESPEAIGRALFSHPAVSSLGCDFILSCISFVCWRFTRRSENAAEHKKTA